MDEKNLYQIARILRGHGIKGELKFAAINRYFDQIDQTAEMYLEDRFQKIQEVHIEKLRLNQTDGIVKFKEIGDRTEADKFSGGFLLIDKKELPKLPRQEYYLDDLLGMDIIDEDGINRGILTNVFPHAAYDMYEILHDGRKSLIPAVKEFVTDINIKKRTITVHVIEGLLD